MGATTFVPFLFRRCRQAGPWCFDKICDSFRGSYCPQYLIKYAQKHGKRETLRSSLGKEETENGKTLELQI
jgi:hypothetical protein